MCNKKREIRGWYFREIAGYDWFLRFYKQYNRGKRIHCLVCYETLHSVALNLLKLLLELLDKLFGLLELGLQLLR